MAAAPALAEHGVILGVVPDMGANPNQDLELSAAEAASTILPSTPPRNRSTRRVLEPTERTAEVLFGLLMVLAFVGALSVAEGEQADVKALLIGTLGCNFVWAVIDGLFYLMGCLAEKGRNLATYRAVLAARTPDEWRTLVAGALPPVVISLMTTEEIDAMRERALRLPAPPDRARLDRRDWLGAWAVFLLMFAATFPVALPFMFITGATLAMRVSNAFALAMLFVAGYLYGRAIHRSPFAVGIAIVFIGIVIVTFTITLGG